jgi:hypothetical protein
MWAARWEFAADGVEGAAFGCCCPTQPYRSVGQCPTRRGRRDAATSWPAPAGRDGAGCLSPRRGTPASQLSFALEGSPVELLTDRDRVLAVEGVTATLLCDAVIGIVSPGRDSPGRPDTDLCCFLVLQRLFVHPGWHVVERTMKSLGIIPGEPLEYG